MSGLLTSYVDDRLEVMEEWDADAVVESLQITTQELLEVPAFRKRAEEWIMENCP